MDKLEKLKSLILCMGLSVLVVLVITLYGLGIYTALYDSFKDVSTLLDVTKWQHLSYG